MARVAVDEVVTIAAENHVIPRATAERVAAIASAQIIIAGVRGFA